MCPLDLALQGGALSSSLTAVAFLGGIVPALLWLAFWLLEDRCEPEPKKLLLLVFLAGMAIVLPVLYLEKCALAYFSGTTLWLVWAAIEEIMKFGAAYFVALRTRFFDAPLDAVIYLVTAALGFAAAENMLFIMGPLAQGDVLQTIVTGNLRFIGATLLHTLASATIGLSLAFAFYERARVRRLAALCGVILAISLHTLFNFFILGSGSAATFWIFLFLWIGIVALLLGVECVKRPARDYC